MKHKTPSQKRKQATRREADSLFSRYIRARDQRCKECGNEYMLQCAHLVSRRYAATRHDPANAVALCGRCHMRFTHNPIAWDEWCIAWMGEEEWRALRKRALAGVTSGRVDYKAVIAWLRTELAQMEE